MGVAFAVSLALALAACASAGSSVPADACVDCPTAQLSANGSATLTVAAGTNIAYTWSSSNADQATSTVKMSPGPDACGNTDGAWVIKSLQGSLPALPLLPCQAGTTYTLELTVTQSSSGKTASSSVVIAVSQ